ncbi:MAG: FAD:protein FMN transferase [Eubacteriales bacterium]|nr:FAD:protein FMN transferase [Eubacteriales bacterium]
MKIKRSALSLLLLLGFLLGGCGLPTPSQRYEKIYLDVFDTVTTVVLYDSSQQSANAKFDELHDILLSYHKLYDIYHTYDGVNNLCTVNQNAGIAPVKVDEKILDLIEYAIGMDTLTSGRMNIAMGGVLQIWQTYRDAGLEEPDSAALPPMDELKAANADAVIGNVVADRLAGTLFVKDAKTQIDVGAIAKGYAAQRAVDAMKSAGVTSMLLSVGGNVCSIGTRADGTRWKVGIQNPYGEGNIAAVQVEGQSVVTSGTYERYYTVDGKRYHHIIDPDTLMPSVRYDSVTVISSDSALADALTTGLFCMPIDEGMALVEQLPDTEALWVLPDGTQQMSGGFSTYIVKE